MVANYTSKRRKASYGSQNSLIPSLNYILPMQNEGGPPQRIEMGPPEFFSNCSNELVNWKKME